MRKKIENSLEKIEEKLEKSPLLGIRTYYWTAILFEFIIAAGLSLAVVLALNHFLDIEDSSLLPVFSVLLCSSITAGISFYLNRWVLTPIRKLGGAMRQVARGEFKIQVPTKSKIRDITEINRNFNLMVRALDGTEMLQSDFVSNVSHEFKTPLTAIEGYAMLLQGTPQITREQQEYVEKILLNTQRLSGLIGNVLLLSKIENQQIPETVHPFQLDEQIRKVIMLYEPQWTEKDIELDVELTDVVYNGSENLLFHVWSNLISNAIKFNRQGGVMRLHLTDEDDHILFTVEDQGPGIPEEDLAHIFDKFYQGDNSHRQSGNGLGLSLVMRILNACGGTVSVKNLDGGGASFCVHLKK